MYYYSTTSNPSRWFNLSLFIQALERSRTNARKRHVDFSRWAGASLASTSKHQFWRHAVRTRACWCLSQQSSGSRRSITLDSPHLAPMKPLSAFHIGYMLNYYAVCTSDGEKLYTFSVIVSITICRARHASFNIFPLKPDVNTWK